MQISQRMHVHSRLDCVIANKNHNVVCRMKSTQIDSVILSKHNGNNWHFAWSTILDHFEQWQRIITCVCLNHSNPFEKKEENISGKYCAIWQSTIYPCIKSLPVCHQIILGWRANILNGICTTACWIQFMILRIRQRWCFFFSNYIYNTKINMLSCVNRCVYAFCLFVSLLVCIHIRVYWVRMILVLRERLIYEVANVVIYSMSKLIRSQFTSTQAHIHIHHTCTCL